MESPGSSPSQTRPLSRYAPLPGRLWVGGHFPRTPVFWLPSGGWVHLHKARLARTREMQDPACGWEITLLFPQALLSQPMVPGDPRPPTGGNVHAGMCLLPGSEAGKTPPSGLPTECPWGCQPGMGRATALLCPEVPRGGKQLPRLYSKVPARDGWQEAEWRESESQAESRCQETGSQWNSPWGGREM